MGIASTPALSGLSRHWGTEMLLLEELIFRGGASGLMLQVPQRWVCLPPYQPHSSASLCDTWDQHLRQHHHRLSQGGHPEFAQWTCWLPDAQNGLRSNRSRTSPGSAWPRAGVAATLSYTSGVVSSSPKVS